MLGQTVQVNSMKAGFHYLIAVVILTVYGIEVCPFLERLGPFEIATVLVLGFVISGCVRFFIFKQICKEGTRVEGAGWSYRPARILLLDLGLWVLAAILVGGWNFWVYDFPPESGLKVVLGCVTLGIFSSALLALDAERDLIVKLSELGNSQALRTHKFFSITSKFMLFVGSSLVVISAVVLLLIYKDFTFVISEFSNGRSFEFSWIVREVLFVFAVLILGCFLVARRYSRNLRLMFDLQLKAFGAVEKGNYDTLVPLVSNDEFSVIAEQTNKMIGGLKERERIKRAFGKYMDPQVAEAVLSSEEETNLGGRQANVAIMFTDLRNFTPLSERCTPQQTVAVLNEYFTMVVSAVHRHGGVVDKFIGDAAMAIFGLDGTEGTCDKALRAASDIHRGLSGLNEDLVSRDLPEVRLGIGVHYGVAVAGNIGSEERLEYTVIGDSVNTASRLESLTKELTSPVAVSADFYNELSEAGREDLVYIGECDLKGKSSKCPVYGIPMTAKISSWG
jgi:adenylate cyclase